MNIYFSFSITGGREFQPILHEMAALMLQAGYEVPTAINTGVEIEAAERACSAEEIYRRDIAWIDVCDFMVAEVSTPSHGVGFEINYGLMTGKQVYCYYRADKTVSKMLTGNQAENFHISVYQDMDDLMQQLHHLFVYCRQD
jgi:nucleoside 2-deoxyribosyltransferase